jgi:four helix bundle protein
MVNNFIGHKRLIAWQKADELTHLVYKLSLTFPKNELFGLTSQLQRAVLSVPLNIVEGYGRNSKKEFARFLSISLGSLAEVGYLLEFAFDMEYITKQDFEKLFTLKEETGQLIWKLYKSIK